MKETEEINNIHKHPKCKTKENAPDIRSAPKTNNGTPSGKSRPLNMGNWHSNFRDLTKSIEAKKNTSLPHTGLLATAMLLRIGLKHRAMKYTLAATKSEQRWNGLQCIIANRGFGVNGKNNLV